MKFKSAQNNTIAKLPILKLENGNLWVSVPQTTQENGVSVTKTSVPVTAEEKINKKNDVKAKSLLLMALPNEHPLTFSVVITQEDLNSTFLRSLPPEWNTHKSVGASTGPQNMAFMTALSTSSTNNVNTANPAYEASTVSPNVNTASPQQDLEQIHEDDLKAMNLRWQLSLLSIRAKRYFQRIGKKIFINANNTAGKQGNNEDTSSKAMLAIDASTYKRGLATIEEQLVTYKKNEVLFSEKVAVLKREVACKDYEIIVHQSEFEKVKQEKEGIELKIENFDNASKSLDKLIGSQITEHSKKGLGYHDVPPPHPLIYNGPTKLDLSYSGLDEFKGYGPMDSKLESDINHE
nr:hypothetical protein [Tanacetum cinerariifolium]